MFWAFGRFGAAKIGEKAGIITALLLKVVILY